MYPHRINLKGPWDAQPLALTRLRRDGAVEPVEGPVPPPLKMAMPCRWADAGLPGFQGKVRFRRGFGWPNPLGAHERLWLVVNAADCFAQLSVNDRPLGEHVGAFEPFEFEIGALVGKTNELVVDVDCPKADPVAANEWLWRGKLGPGGGLWGTTYLEVRRESFLRLGRIEAAWDAGHGSLRIAGEIVVEGERKLDLSVRLDGKELCYQPTAPGPFSVALDAGAAEPWRPGRPRLHELLIQLNDVAFQHDQKWLQIGFREEAARTEATTLPWSQPLAEMSTLDLADEEGKLVLLEPPVRPGDVPDADRRAAAERLLARLSAGAGRHPSFAGFAEDRRQA